MKKYTIWLACLLAGALGYTSLGAAPPIAQTPAAQPAPQKGKTILFVAGNSNGTSQPGESIGEKFLLEHLKTLGFTVTVISDGAAKDELLAKAEASALVMIGESTTSGRLTNKLYTTPRTIFSMESFTQDDFGLTAGGRGADPGVPPDQPFGVKDQVTELDIVDAASPLAAGLKGTVKVYKEAKQMNWGMVDGDAHVVATLAGEKRGAVIYYVKKGGMMHDGTKALGTRLQFFIEDDNVTGTPNLMTAEGIKLFDAALNWSLAN
jgi:hypothetical protein